MNRYNYLFIIFLFITTPIFIFNYAIQYERYSYVKTYHTTLQHIPNYKGMSSRELWKFYDSLIVELHTDSLIDVKPFNPIKKDDLTFQLFKKSRVELSFGVISFNYKVSDLKSEKIVDTLEAGKYWLEPNGIFKIPGKYYWGCNIDSQINIQSFYVR